jgi:hypothetical protein
MQNVACFTIHGKQTVSGFFATIRSFSVRGTPDFRYRFRNSNPTLVSGCCGRRAVLGLRCVGESLVPVTDGSPRT